jgi:hypothetical protein
VPAAVEGGRRRRSRSRRRHSRRRMGGGLFDMPEAPIMGGRPYGMFGGAALDGVLGGDIDGGRRRRSRSRRHHRRW